MIFEPRISASDFGLWALGMSLRHPHIDPKPRRTIQSKNIDWLTKKFSSF